MRDSHHLICKAHDYFKAQITAYVAADFKKIEGLLSSIVHDFCVIQISLDESGKPKNIFISRPPRGRSLSEFDLLRNNLFLRAEDDRDRLYHTSWIHFEEDPFWNPEILDQFLHDFLTAKLGIEIETSALFELYDRHRCSSLEANQGIEYELAELKQHAEVYREKIERDA